MSAYPAAAAQWFKGAFDALYPIVYAHRTVEAAAPEAAFAIAKTALRRGERALDLCCGNGRHLVHLARHAPRAIGLDYSADLLGFARAQVGAHIPLVRGDMRALPFLGAFDVVFNFFTSFGYFFDEAENMATARAFAAALKPDGRFFIDYLNPRHVERTLTPHSERTHRGYRIVEERWIDSGLQRINKRTVVSKGGEAVSESLESVRMYAREELMALLRDAGLDTEYIFGDYHDDACADDECPRIILTGQRRR